jgi:ribonucleotide reductase alpha subunit
MDAKFELAPLGQIVWEDRYALKDETGNRIENDILDTFKRVAKAIASKEKDPKKWEKKFYDIMANRYFCPAGRILAHAGTHYSQLLNCFVLPFKDDSLEAIMDTAKNTAIIQKFGGGCIGGESLVLTDKGPIPIKKIVEDVDKNLRVLSYNSETKEIEYCAILDRHVTPMSGDRVFEIEFDNMHGGVIARMHASDWHPFFVFDGEKIIQVRADKLKHGMAVIGATGFNAEYDDWGWLLGYIAGDGTIEPNGDGYNRVRIVDDSQECVERASNILNVPFKISKDDRFQIDMWDCQAYGDMAGKIKNEFGGYQTCYTKSVPQSMWTSSSERRFSFIVGYLDSDGYYNKDKKRFEVFSVSKDLAYGIIALAGGLGIRTSVRFRKARKKNESDGWEVRIYKSQILVDAITKTSAKRDPINTGWACGSVELSSIWKEKLADIGINVNTKEAWRKKIEIDNINASLVYWLQYGKASRETTAAILRVCGEEKLANAVLSSQIVRSVKSTGISEVLYDLTIEKNQTYIASDPTTGAYVVVHNTGFNYSQLRPSGSYIKGVNGRSCGVIGFINMMSTISEVIEQGGSRRGANLGLMEVWHPDVWEFISYKTDHNWECLREFIDIRDEEKWAKFKFENTYKLQMYNISIGVSDEFFEALRKDDTWPLMWKDKEWELYSVQFRKMKEGTYIDTLFELTADSDKTAIWKAKKIIPYPTAKDSFEVISKRKIKASEIWDRICYNAWADGCPGLINLSTARKMHNLEYVHPILSTNPCITGETLVAVADGRVAVPIKQLAEEGKDVPIYCRNDEKKRVSIRMMRNPRITGYNQKILKVTIENGHSLRVTETHKFVLSDGSIVMAKDLKCGDSFSIMTRLQAPFDFVVKNSNSKSQDYFWINSTDKKTWILDHRLIYNFYNKGKNFGFKEIIHHKDYNGLNNTISNLDLYFKKDHDKLHSEDKIGDKNPMRRAQTEWSKEKWQDYHNNMSKATAGELNGRFSGISNEELFDKAVELSKKFERKLTTQEWEDFALKNEYPSQFSEYRIKTFGTVINFLDKAAVIANVQGTGLEASALREFKRFLKIKEESDLDVFFENGVIKVNRICEGCHKKFVVGYMQREQSYCTQNCHTQHYLMTADGRSRLLQSKEELRKKKRLQQINAFNDLKIKLGRIPMKKEFAPYCKEKGIPFRLPVKREVAQGKLVGTFHSWKELEETALQYNHRVLSIIEDGMETVFNGTVDEFHNFYTGHFEESFEGHKKFIYVNNRQCGEQPLPAGGSCNLSSIILPSFVKNDLKNPIDWDGLKTTIHTAVRFADNVIDICEFPIQDIQKMAQKERRIGLGTMGVHDMLIALKLGYDTEEGRTIVDTVLQFIRDEAYRASIELAKEKGSFPVFSKEKFLESGFIKTLPQDIQEDIGRHSIRNSCLTSQAPTGTIGTMYNASTGCEPWFSLSFQRNTRLGSYEDGCPAYINWKKDNPDQIKPEYFKTAPEIAPEDHIKMMTLFSKYIDSAVSKTINMPSSATVDDIKKAFIMAMENGVKGMTVFREGCKEGVLISKSKEKKEIITEAKKVVQELQEVKHDDESDSRISPKKRGNRLVGSTTRIHMQKHNLYVIVNKNKSGDIVEVFATVGESKEPDAHHTSGVEDSWAEAVGKMISLALRAGVKPTAIVRNLKNIPSDKPVFHTIGDGESSEPIPSPPHAIARVIEEELKYSYPVQHKSEVQKTGGQCPKCSSINLKWKSYNCFDCLDCGQSGCGS